MTLNTDSCYQALLSRDRRFDGVFFVAVSSTGIYCRTVCTAKTPMRKNCRFYESAAAAEKAGFRPCLKCRPELSPGNARIDSLSQLAAQVAARLEDGDLAHMNIEELASQLKVSDRHLRRVVEREFGVSLIELAQTNRLLLARRLLLDSRLSITETAFASGFSSVRRFNALFKERYGVNPSEIRKKKRKAVSQSLTSEISFREPFDWRALLSFLQVRAIRGVESIELHADLHRCLYRRTVAIGSHRGWVCVRLAGERSALQVEISHSLSPVINQVLARVRRLFDLNADPRLIAAHLGAIAARRPGLRVPGSFDGFETAVRAILGQQVSVKAATTLAARFTAACAETIETPFADLTYLSATAEKVAGLTVDEIARLGIVSKRAACIIALAQLIGSQRLKLDPPADTEQVIETLKQLPGIGDWTAQYIAMRALSWPDAFPHGDLGIAKALKQPHAKTVLQLAEPWRPWRAYATMHLWSSLENED